MKQVLACVLVLGLCVVSGATDYYVDAGRPDDLGVGTSWGTAKKYIASALALASAGEPAMMSIS